MKNITVIILTYNTPEKIISNCLESIDSDIKIIIVENSKTFLYDKNILSKFKNVEIVCTGKNLGYGAGNNYGIQLSKTDYILILNPDIICDKDFFFNLKKITDEKQNFSIIGCQYLHDDIFMPAGFFDKTKNQEFIKNFKNNKIDELEKVDWVTGCSMLINLKKFENKRIFDENFFLYFEEFDLCKSLMDKGNNVYTSQKLKIHHLGFKSSINQDLSNERAVNNLREWHWMWSTFYFYKKNFSYLYALKKTLGKFIKAFFKIIFYSITSKQAKKNKYKHRFLGIYNALINRPSTFRNDTEKI